MTLPAVLILSGALFSLGAYGLLSRGHLIGVLMALELMVNAALVNFVAFARLGKADTAAGSAAVVLALAVTAGEMALALALIIVLRRRQGGLIPDGLADLHG